MTARLLPENPNCLALPEVCAGCGEATSLNEEKVCVPGCLAAPWWPFGDEPTRVFHADCYGPSLTVGHSRRTR